MSGGVLAGRPAAIEVVREGAVATVRVGTGRRANALGSRDWRALAELFRERLAVESGLRAVVLAGHGRGAFCAGSDMREWVDAGRREVDDCFAAMEAAFTAVEELPVPVVASVRGAALGAGCQLACACDLRLVADTAVLGMPIVRWGILTPPAFAARLARLTGPGLARDLLYTGRLLDAAEAERHGLAGRRVPSAELDTLTATVVDAIARQPPTAVRAAKRAVDALDAPARERLARLDQNPTTDAEAMRRGLRAFLHHPGDTG